MLSAVYNVPCSAAQPGRRSTAAGPAGVAPLAAPRSQAPRIHALPKALHEHLLRVRRPQASSTQLCSGGGSQPSMELDARSEQARSTSHQVRSPGRHLPASQAAHGWRSSCAWSWRRGTQGRQACLPRLTAGCLPWGASAAARLLQSSGAPRSVRRHGCARRARPPLSCLLPRPLSSAAAGLSRRASQQPAARRRCRLGTRTKILTSWGPA
jgi:hypothetical protein